MRALLTAACVSVCVYVSCLPQVQQLVGAFATHLHDAQPGHVQRVVRCTTQLATACAGHNALAWIQWQPPPLSLLLRHLLLQRRSLKQYHVASVLKDVALVGSLFMPFEEAAEAEAAGATDIAGKREGLGGFKDLREGGFSLREGFESEGRRVQSEGLQSEFSVLPVGVSGMQVLRVASTVDVVLVRAVS